MASQSSLMDIIDTTTILSLLSTLAILGAAYLLSIIFLHATTSGKTRFFFIWHAFDALIHFILEGSYLYNCFFSYIDLTSSSSGNISNPVLGSSGGLSSTVSAYLPPNVHFLGQTDRLYGAEYGTSPFSALWREYAKADKRWAGTDLTVVSLELLTVLLAGPCAVWICVCIARSSNASAAAASGGSARRERQKTTAGEEWFWMVVLATGELYGGFMTFAPEWLSGQPNLDTSNIMYLWVYLFFFNMLWVWIPLIILVESYTIITEALRTHSASVSSKKTQ